MALQTIRLSTIVILALAAWLPRSALAADVTESLYPASALMATQWGVATVQREPLADEDWGSGVVYTIDLSDDESVDVYASAKLLADEDTARAFFQEMSRALLDDNERVDIQTSEALRGALSLDDLLEARIIYTDPDSDERISDYARLWRIGTIVIQVEAIGDTDLDDSGATDGKRLMYISRLTDELATQVRRQLAAGPPRG